MKLTGRSRTWIVFIFIVVLAAGAFAVTVPGGPDIAIRTVQRELKIHLGLDLQGGSHLVYEADTTNIPKSDQAEALEGVRDVLERRVNTFGVSEPVVQTNVTGDVSRVIIELPGVSDVNDAINRIGKVPELEFREPPPSKSTPEEQAKQDTEAKAKAEDILKRVQAGEDFASLAKESSEDTTAADGGDLGFFGRGDMVKEFEDAAFSTEPGKVYPSIVKSPFGYHVIKVEEKKTEKSADGKDVEKVRARHILFKVETDANSNSPLAVFGYISTGLSGKHLQRASVQFSNKAGYGEPEISLAFNDEGKDLFAEITKRNLGKPVAIFLDGYPISVPVVNSEITSGQAVISGSFTIDEAKNLVRNLNAGALPVPIKLVSQQNIGASLGEVALQESFVAGLLGLVLVILYMVVYYRLPGLLAAVALGIYTMMVIAIFKLLPVTLTLAGIAGFILSIGLAVDANVLIFERLREELRSGKSLPAAVEDGFSRAWLSIRDSNASSLLTCAILTWFGTSLIKGFALTLAIGILVSMFSAITITRTFLRLITGNWAEKRLYLFAHRIQKRQG